MLKTELIEKVSELETRLSNSNAKTSNLLNTASDLLFGKKERFSMYNESQRITNTNQLFFEIGKLVEFRNNILEEKQYNRQKEDNINELEYLRNKVIETTEQEDKCGNDC